MEKYYTSERNVQILVALLKKHKIKRIVVSPGTTNLTFVACVQHDEWFEVYSSVDERSAAYIACGMAHESGEPVVLTCTEATASRNYMSGMTEAYYRKLPLLAVTGTRGNASVGNLVAQAIDRSIIPNDVAKVSIELPSVHDAEEEWYCELSVNRAILELFRNGGGPVHINLCTTYSKDFSVKKLPDARKIHRITVNEFFPELPQGSKIAIYIGSHQKWSDEEIKLIDGFCNEYGAVVLYDHTSGYHGKYGVLFSLIAGQEAIDHSKFSPDLLIHFGEISGGVYNLNPKAVWRVSEDGELRDRYRKLEMVFEMNEKIFLQHYVTDYTNTCIAENMYLVLLRQLYTDIISSLPDLPFSNIWIANYSAKRLPAGAYLHLGILNSLRSWNFFELSNTINSLSNVGGFGIDGCMSSLVGASLVNQNRLHFCVLGDLAFFYDMNILGNRHIRNNVRILMINNGRGTEFRNYGHPGAAFGEAADQYIAAAGHFGNKSPLLVKHLSEDLGFDYLVASNKTEFISCADKFFSDEKLDNPIIFEVFTDSVAESEALKMMRNIYVNNSVSYSMKQTAKKVLGEAAIEYLKKFTTK